MVICSNSQSAGTLVIDLSALARNYHRLAEAAAPAECGAVVKANAYGLGVEPVASRLFAAGCRSFFVATLPEGQQLRAVLPDAKIYVFEGLVDGAQAALTESALTPVLNSIEQIKHPLLAFDARSHFVDGKCLLNNRPHTHPGIK